MTNWAENCNVYIEAQAGFREKMSTVDNIVYQKVRQVYKSVQIYYNVTMIDENFE